MLLSRGLGAEGKGTLAERAWGRLWDLTLEVGQKGPGVGVRAGGWVQDWGLQTGD